MGRQAEGPGRARRSLGLAAAILSSGFLLTQAIDILVMINPPLPIIGGDVTLTPGGNPDFVVCLWYRGGEAEADKIFTYTPSTQELQRGAEFTGRESEGPGCSLRITSLRFTDSATYTVSKIVRGGAEMGHVAILILEPLSTAQALEIPISTEPPQPLQGQDVTLTPGGSPDFMVCLWYREKAAEANRILTYIPSSHEQQRGPNFTQREIGGLGCFLRIQQLILEDSGNYVVSKIVEGGTEMGQVQIEVVIARHHLSNGVIAGIPVWALAGAVLIGVLF